MTEQELKELIWYGQGDTPPELALQWLNATLESRVEYETEHKDSGDNYALLVQESWDYYDIDDYIWTEVLDSATYTDSADNVWHLWQDGDLWAYCDALMSDSEYEDFFGEPRA